MAKTLIKSLTASSSATLDFVDGTSDVVMDNTYPVYEFHYVNMHPATNTVDFRVQFNASAGSGFNETITSTIFVAYHSESTGATTLSYDPAGTSDQAQGTAYQDLAYETGNDADQSVSGVLTLYDPSSTTYVKHFMARSNNAYASDFTIDNNVAGYINTTSAIDEISFKFDSGNIDAGTIYMYGVS